MNAQAAAIRIIGVGGYGASVLAQLWLNHESRRLLEECGPVVWQVMESSTYDLSRSLELSPALLHGADASRNKELLRALRSGAEIEIKTQSDVLVLDECAHVLVGLGGTASQYLIQSLKKNEQQQRCHIYACLPYEFDKAARERAHEELVTLLRMQEPQGDQESRLNVTDRANFVQGSMLESMEKIKDHLIHRLMLSVLGA